MPLLRLWEYFPKPQDIVPVVVLIIWVYYVYRLDINIGSTVVTHEKLHLIAIICLDDPTATNDYNLPDTKETLVLKFRGDDSDLSTMKVEKYIAAIEVMDVKNQITIFSQLKAVDYDKTYTRASFETVVAERYPETPCFAIGIPIQSINVIMSLNIRLKEGIYELNEGPMDDISITQNIDGLLY